MLALQDIAIPSVQKMNKKQDRKITYFIVYERLRIFSLTSS